MKAKEYTYVELTWNKRDRLFYSAESDLSRLKKSPKKLLTEFKKYSLQLRIETLHENRTAGKEKWSISFLWNCSPMSFVNIIDDASNKKIRQAKGRSINGYKRKAGISVNSK